MAGKNATGIELSRGEVYVRDAGEHLSCAKLSRMGILTGLAPINSPEIDIFATVNNKVMLIQVKSSAREKNPTWVVKKRPKDLENFYFVFVNWEDKKMPEFFIVPSKKVKEVWKEPSRNDKSGWVNKTDIKIFLGQWKLIAEFFWGKTVAYYEHKF